MDTTLTPDHRLRPLLVVAWRDPVVDAFGFDPRSSYVERFWLPLLGPTSTWLLRRLAAEFDDQPDGFSLDAVDCARSIGIGNRGGRNGPFHRSIERCIRFGLARREEHEIIAVRTRIPPLSRTQSTRLPRDLTAQHDRWQDEQRRRSTRPADDAHAIRLARSLLAVGASPSDVEDQLQRWDFDVSSARRAVDEAVAVTEPGAARAPRPPR